jgi:dipeptidyl-peptidase-3
VLLKIKKEGDALGLLIKYYKTGSLKTWDDYNIAWLSATEGNIDYINGFIEVYNDPLGYRGSYEGIVQIKDFDMSKKMEKVSKTHSGLKIIKWNNIKEKT